MRELLEGKNKVAVGIRLILRRNYSIDTSGNDFSLSPFASGWSF